jgi:hypothetical protein
MLHKVLTCEIWRRTFLTATRAQDSFLHVHSAAHTAAVNMNRLWSRTRACRRFVPHLRHWLCGSNIHFIRKKFTLQNRECTSLCNEQQQQFFLRYNCTVTKVSITTATSTDTFHYHFQWVWLTVLNVLRNPVSVCLSPVHLCTCISSQATLDRFWLSTK